MLDHLDSPMGTSWYLWLFSFKYSFGFCTSCTPTFFLPLPGPTMVVDRDEKWMPVLPCNPSRAMGPSSSAPAGRSSSGGSETPPPPNSSDDEASSSWNITSRCSPKSVFSLIFKFREFKKQLIREMGFGGFLTFLVSASLI
ncbi:hypothetical protein PAHAL_3G344600 [Panicum hallii]|uniref:Uncharacterized protein n=1 Tax=Panicum hallii TaxID=206008 RepID=A0A2T8KKB5_9POAL|nr:hypothetical protein PAHAL_3G344600 [Panicum hallii]